MQLKNKKSRPDYVYNNEMVNKFINHLMYDGKKSVAMKAFYSSLDLVKNKLENEEPLNVFIKALDNIKPNWEVKSQRIGGSTYQIPSEIKDSRKESLAVRWLIKAARTKKGKSIVKSLSEEIIDAYNNTGIAYKKKEDTHKTAEANRAFAHYGRNS